MPGQPDAAALLAEAAARYRAGRGDEAFGLLQEALARTPGQPHILYVLALLRADAGQSAEAEANLRDLVARYPGHAPAHLLLGAVLREAGRIAEALDELRQTVTLAPDLADAWMNLGMALLDAAAGAEAIAALRRAVTLAPERPEPRCNLAAALLDRGQPALAAAMYDAALARAPTSVGAQNGRAFAHLAEGRPWAAHAALRRTTTLAPATPAERWNAALARLRLADFPAAWEAFEVRWHVPGGPRRPPLDPARAWHGDAPVAGRSLLVYAEQGLGDSLHFARYLPLLAERGARVTLWVPPPTLPLLAPLPGVVAALPNTAPPPPTDLHCALGGLGRAFATTEATIPARVPYLAAPPERLARWRARFGRPAGERRVGIAWSGNPRHPTDARRSIPLARFRRLLDGAACRFVVLQTRMSEADAALLATLPGIIDPRPDIVDLADTAAIVHDLDLVVAVDTAPAHVAAALGKPVILLLAAWPDWRWQLERRDSPWYPTARLIRQRRFGPPAESAWDTALDEARAALDDAVGR